MNDSVKLYPPPVQAVADEGYRDGWKDATADAARRARQQAENCQRGPRGLAAATALRTLADSLEIGQGEQP